MGGGATLRADPVRRPAVDAGADESHSALPLFPDIVQLLYVETKGTQQDAVTSQLLGAHKRSQCDAGRYWAGTALFWGLFI